MVYGSNCYTRIPARANRFFLIYSDNSANEDNSFRNHIFLAERFVSRNVISRRFL